MTLVFLSYSRRGLAFVKTLAGDLKVAGLDVWHDLSGWKAARAYPLNNFIVGK